MINLMKDDVLELMIFRLLYFDLLMDKIMKGIQKWTHMVFSVLNTVILEFQRVFGFQQT